MKKIYLNLRRITSSGAFIPQIDGLRFLAIILVLVYHLEGKLIHCEAVDMFSKSLQSVINGGYRGVELFFVISGFILGLPFAKHYIQHESKVNLKKYFLRRLTRLEPPYMIILILFFLGYLIFDSSYNFSQEAGNFLSSLTYTHNLYSTSTWRMNGVTWSLEIEIQFYILAPLLAYLFKIPTANLRRIVILTLIFISIVVNHVFFFKHISLFNFLHFFLAGFLFADLSLSIQNIKINRFLSLLIGSMLLFIIITVPFRDSLFLEMVFISSIIIFYLFVLKNNLWQRIFSWQILTSIGGMCYTIYLIHFVFEGALMKITQRILSSDIYIVNLLIQSLLVLPVILFCSSIFYLIIEKPCMNKNWPETFSKKIKTYYKQTVLYTKFNKVENI